ncbi:MAG: hypothetical protein HY719_08990 [Planctomycetes bacterium]|nr:hypothetical protein [Planctomycetota bacterium]
MPRKRDVIFGKLSVKLGLITPQQYEQAVGTLRESGADGRSMGDLLVELGHLTPQQREAIERAQSVQTRERENSLFSKIAVQNGFVTEDQIRRCVADFERRQPGKPIIVGELLIMYEMIDQRDFQKVRSAIETLYSKTSREEVLFGRIAVAEHAASETAIMKGLAIQNAPGEERKLGQIMVEEKLMSPAAVEKVLRLQHERQEAKDKRRQRAEERKFAKLILHLRLITPEQMGQAVAARKESPQQPLAEIVVAKGFLNRDQVQVILDRLAGRKPPPTPRAVDPKDIPREGKDGAGEKPADDVDLPVIEDHDIAESQGEKIAGLETSVEEPSAGAAGNGDPASAAADADSDADSDSDEAVDEDLSLLVDVLGDEVRQQVGKSKASGEYVAPATSTAIFALPEEQALGSAQMLARKEAAQKAQEAAATTATPEKSIDKKQMKMVAILVGLTLVLLVLVWKVFLK